MSLIIPANTLASGGYAVDNSCRFNSGSSDALIKTLADPGGAGNRNKWTFSTWIKRSKLGTNQWIFGSYQSSAYYTSINFETNDTLNFFDYYNSSVNGKRNTNRVFRDTSAWYHIVCIWDKDNGTSSQKMRIYVNGTEETSFATSSAPSNATTLNADGQDISIGQKEGVGSYIDGYLAETVFNDGQAYTADNYGEFDSDSGIFKPIDGLADLTFGTSGFYLDFKDSANLGNDVNGGTDLTENNLTAIDQTTDTPTNNFATFNPLINNWTSISEGNLKVTNSTQAYRDVFSTFAVSQGKWYVECRIDVESGGTYPIFGIADAGDYSYPAQHNLIGTSANGYGFYTDGNYFNNGSDIGNWSTLANGDVIGFYLDLDSGTKTLKVYKNGSSEVSVNINNPIDGYYFGCSTFQADGASGSINFGNPTYALTSAVADANGYGSFEYNPTIGGVNYLSLCTANLSEVLG
mgnify:CR=1 FL=1